MSRPMFFSSLAVTAALLLLASSAVMAQDKPAYKPFDFGLSAGMIMPGGIYIGIADEQVVTSASPFFKAHVDAYIVEKLAMGLYVSYLKLSLDHWKGSTAVIPDAYNGVTGFEIGCAIKPCFWLNDQVALKPALEIGYRRMSLDYIADDENASVNGMALGGNLALKFKAGAVSPFVDGGIISQPVGGNDYTSVSFAPIFALSGGIEF